MSKTTALNLALFSLVAVALLFCVLALANSGTEQPCRFNRVWLGCLLSKHDGLAGGLLGALVTLAAAWVAWSAVQRQIDETKALALADRNEAKRMLSADLSGVADGLGAVWRILRKAAETGDEKAFHAAHSVVQWALERITAPEAMKGRRQMLSALAWKDRQAFTSLVNRIDELSPFSSEKWCGSYDDFMDVIRSLSFEFEICLPKTYSHFEGFPRGCPKAMSFGDLIRRGAGVEGQEGYGSSSYDDEFDD